MHPTKPIDVKELIQCQLNNIEKLIKDTPFDYSYNAQTGIIEIITKNPSE